MQCMSRNQLGSHAEEAVSARANKHCLKLHLFVILRSYLAGEYGLDAFVVGIILLSSHPRETRCISMICAAHDQLKCWLTLQFHSAYSALSWQSLGRVDCKKESVEVR